MLLLPISLLLGHLGQSAYETNHIYYAHYRTKTRKEAFSKMGKRIKQWHKY